MSHKWKWVYNPFERIAGWKALGIGMIILAVTTFIGYWGDTIFFALEIKSVPGIALGEAFILQMMGLAVTIVIMYVFALIFAKRTRFQDILGTVTLAKYPLLLMALSSLALDKQMSSIDINKLLRGDISTSVYIVLCVYSIISILVVVWEVTLLYNAFKVSTNLKGVKCAVLFVSAILVSEIISLALKYIIY